MPFRIIRDDITRVKADAIVNTANPMPAYGGGTDLAIYAAAGAEALLAERRKIGPMQPGEVFATKALGLPARHIIHAVGPGWAGGGHGELECLAACYRKSLLLAQMLGLKSIAFPLMATGTNGFPKDKALDIALKEISAFLEDNEMDVTLVVFNREAFVLSSSLARDVRQYIDDHYAEKKEAAEYGRRARGVSLDAVSAASAAAMARLREGGLSSLLSFGSIVGKGRKAEERVEEEVRHSIVHHAAPGVGRAKAASAKAGRRSLGDILDNVGESFRDRLLRLIREKGLEEQDVYKKALLDRKLFSKIRCNPDYRPKKQTAVALAFAMGLNLDETVDLLLSAGLALTNSSKFDLIVMYCLENGIYDLFEINALLFEYEQPMMGCA